MCSFELHTYQIEPRFTTARGTVHDWNDPEGHWKAVTREEQWRYQHDLTHDDLMRAEHPDWDEVKRRFEERGRELNPDFVAFTPQPPRSGPMPKEWEFVPSVVEVKVIAPEHSMCHHTYWTGSDVAERNRSDTNSEYKWWEWIDNQYDSGLHIHERDRRPRDDLDAYCGSTHEYEALALLHPRCFFHGYIPQWDQRSDVTVLDRHAFHVPMVREIPLSDPRMGGDTYLPCIVTHHEAEQLELIVDIERHVVLEWRALIDGVLYARHYFTEIAIDEPMDEAEFYPTGREAP